MAIKTLFGYRPSTRCAECGKTLTDPVSVQRGIGPICWGRGKDDMEMNEANNEYHDGFLEELADVTTHGVILKREPGLQITTWTNIPHLVAHHSPSGYEWGYGGSGPADLALNIVELALRRLGYDGPQMECWDGQKCFEAAWAMHQDFKSQFVATCPQKGGVLSWEIVVAWVEKSTPNYLKLSDKFGHSREDWSNN